MEECKELNNKHLLFCKIREDFETGEDCESGGMDWFYDELLKLVSQRDRRPKHGWLISKSLLEQRLNSRNRKGDLMCKSRNQARYVTPFTSTSKKEEAP